MAGNDWLDYIAEEKRLVAQSVKESRVVSSLSSPYQQQLGIEAPQDTAVFIDTATKHSVIYRCIDRIGRTVSGLPLKVYRTQTDHTRVEVHGGDPVHDLLKKPNLHEPRLVFWWKVSQALETSGAAPIEIVKQGTLPKELYVLYPPHVRVVPSATDYVAGYLYKPSGSSKTWSIPPDEMLYLKYPNPSSEHQALSPLQAAKDDLVLDLNAMAYNKAIFQNRAVPAYALQTEQELEAVHIKRLKKEVQQLFGGAGKAGRTMVLEKGLSWQKIQLTPEEVQWLEGRKMTREDMCAVYGVPPVIAGIYDSPGANYANSREQEDLYWKLCIKPRLDFVEDWLNLVFIPSFADGYHVEFLVNDVLRMSASDRNNIYDKAWQYGRMTINEIRALENQPPSTDPAADKLFVPVNMMPLEDALMAPATPPAPQAAPAVEPAPKTLSKAQKAPQRHVSPGVRARAATSRARALAPIQKEFGRRWKKELQQDQNIIVRALRGGKGFKAEDDPDEYMGQFDEVFGDARKAAYAALAFGFVKNSMAAGAEFGATVSGGVFDLESARAIDLIKTQCTVLADGTTVTMGNKVRSELAAGMQDGETTGQLADRISAIFDGMKAGKADQVARTETSRAYNTASLEAYRDGGVTEKEWLFDGGEEDCPDGSCSAASDMGAIPIDEDFGEAGDGPPAHPSCTCCVLPVFSGSGNEPAAEGE